MKNLLISLTEYKALKNRIDELKEELENRKAELIEYMNEKGESVITCGAYKASLTTCERHSLDEKGIREQFPDIAEQFKKVTTYDRFTVK